MIIIKELEKKAYIEALGQTDEQLVITSRVKPHWLEGLSKEVNLSKNQLQVWLVKEELDILKTRLIKDLTKFGLSEENIELLSADVIQLSNYFSELTGNKMPFVSLRTIDETYFEDSRKSVSREWHVDTSVLTLSCTYVGKGTEWIENDLSLRPNFMESKIINPEVSSELVDQSLVNKFDLFDVSILKGEIRKSEDESSKDFIKNFIDEDQIVEFNTGRGLMHRGPGYIAGDSRRLLLTVSTMEVPDWLSV